MGSTSDWDVMSDAAATLAQFGVEFEKRVVSAHRTPDLLVEYAKTAKSRGLEVIIAGAGGAAHLPGMVASMTALPVIGVPVKSRALNGLDSLLSIVQMPGGVPVATVAINGAKNAALIAVSILALKDEALAARLEMFRAKQRMYLKRNFRPMSAVKTIGIIGGGQLGLMIIEQAHLLGARTICLDPAEDAPAFKISDERIVGRFDDPAALEELCRRSDVVTYEFENVPGDLLVALEQKYNIKQGFRPLFDSQDRLREKSNACDHGLKTPAFMAVDDEESLHRAIARIAYPCVLKTRTLGYDGHGQAVLRGEADLAKARELLAVPCILEEFVPFDFEASVVLVSDGERVICFPVGRNIHKDGILDLCIVPAEMPDQVRERMVSQSKRFMRDCGYRGILAIEYFVKGDEVYFNEMAPRPHNSGHWTIEGSTTNQFRELCRYLLDMPLEEPQLKAPTVMKNILGQDLERAEALARENRPGVYVHIYGKTVSKPKRKMGHVTFVGVTGEEYAAKWADRFVK